MPHVKIAVVRESRDGETRVALVPELAAQLRETKKAAVFATHDRAEALALAGRLAVLLGGHIVQLGRPADVVERPASPAVAALLTPEALLRRSNPAA